MTPSGSALNWRSSVTRGGASARAQRAFGGMRSSARSAAASAAQQRSTARVVDIELLGEEAQKALAPGGVEREIGAPELGRAGPRGDLAAAAVEAARASAARSRSTSSSGRSGRGAPVSTPRAERAISRQALRRLASVRSKTPSRKPTGARSLMCLPELIEDDR